MKKRIYCSCWLLLLCTVYIQAQSRNNRYLNYISQYKNIAVEQMNRYGIPASITLAQGLLESGAGSGTLAVKGNNHFGIKCGSDWRGPTMAHNDDAIGECFRVYGSPVESYIDHSLFLRGKQRYSQLFTLKMADYRGWAYGLKRAGYATSPTYARNLIDLIELYELYKYDGSGSRRIKEDSRNLEDEMKFGSSNHMIYQLNGLLCVTVKRGDTFKSLAKELHVSKRKLSKYNELYKDYTLQSGELLYLEKKNKKAPDGVICHIIRAGDSMHSIAQLYGIRLKYLYKMNKTRVPEDGVLVAGEGIRLR